MWDSCDESECRELNSTRTTADRARPEMFEPTEQGKVSGTFLSFRPTSRTSRNDGGWARSPGVRACSYDRTAMTFADCTYPHACVHTLVRRVRLADTGI